MAPPSPRNESEADAQWRAAGDRIQALLEAISAAGVVAREGSEQLVRELSDLYGAGLRRMSQLAVAADPGLAEAFAADDLVASLLLVHDLHPHSVHRRVIDALDRVRPYLGSHGGDVRLLEVDGDTVRLQFDGSCRSCPSSSVTLELAVEDAVRSAAPEISAIEVIAGELDSSSVIPVEALLHRVHQRTTWQPVPAVAALAAGEVGGFLVAGTVVLACRIDSDVYAYRDRCPRCTESLAGAQLLGTRLCCPRCGALFDAVHAGAGVEQPEHLDPVPVLMRDGVLSIAVAQEVA